MLYLWIGCTLLSQIYYIGIRYILESISSLGDAPYKSSRWFLEIKYFSFEQPLVDQQCRRLVLLLRTNLISLFFGEEEARVNHTQSEKVDYKNTYTTSFPCFSYFVNLKNENMLLDYYHQRQYLWLPQELLGILYNLPKIMLIMNYGNFV